MAVSSEINRPWGLAVASIYGRLFPYRARENREPREDYLSEALADLLNRMPRHEVVNFVGQLFLEKGEPQEAWHKYVASKQDFALSWSTQRPTQSGGRVDILLEQSDGTKLIVVENKIYSPIAQRGQQDSEDEEQDLDRGLQGAQAAAIVAGDQLQRYGAWLAEECTHSDWPGAITLLSHFTPAPETFGKGNLHAYGVPWQHVCRWSDVGRWLRGRSAAQAEADKNALWIILARELADFLEEKGMVSEEMTHFDLLHSELFFDVDMRIRGTFDQIAAAIKDDLSKIGGKKTSGYNFENKGRVVWAWSYLKDAPFTSGGWYVAWGLRFPRNSEWWNDLDPALPELTHAFVCLDHNSNSSIRSEDMRAIVPEGWAHNEGWNELVVGRPIHEFQSASKDFTAGLAEWIRAQIQALEPAISKLRESPNTR